MNFAAGGRLFRLKHSRTGLRETDKRERDMMRGVRALIWLCAAAAVCKEIKKIFDDEYTYNSNVLYT